MEYYTFLGIWIVLTTHDSIFFFFLYYYDKIDVIVIEK